MSMVCHPRRHFVHRAAPIALALAVFAAPGVQARVQLIAVGALDAHGGDKAVLTAAPLENGTPGNQLGGLGSGLVHLRCDRFLALPDRGPNALGYNSAVSGTTSYIARFHTIDLRLQPTPHGPLKYTLVPTLQATTLLWSPTPLVYGDGRAVGLASGKPSLNRDGHDYFTGRSDSVSADADSIQPNAARLDPEGIRASADGKRLYIGEEYGPSIREFDRASGRQLRVLALPHLLAVPHPSPATSQELHDNDRGRFANHGIEGLAISPDNRTLFAIMQGALIQDGGKHAGMTRLLRIDLRTGAVTQYAYPLDHVGHAGHAGYAGASDLLAVNGHRLLVLERDSTGLGAGSKAKIKRVYEVDLAGARPIGDRQGEAALRPLALHKTLFVDIVAELIAAGEDPADIPEKIEGLAFGPRARIDGKLRDTLYLASDNDFLPDIKDALHPAGEANPNRFFVFAFGSADLPGYVPAPATAHCNQ